MESVYDTFKLQYGNINIMVSSFQEKLYIFSNPLLRHISPFQIDNTSFSMTFVGQGYDNAEKERNGQKPNKIVTTKIIGPGTHGIIDCYLAGFSSYQMVLELCTLAF